MDYIQTANDYFSDMHGRSLFHSNFRDGDKWLESGQPAEIVVGNHGDKRFNVAASPITKTEVRVHITNLNTRGVRRFTMRQSELIGETLSTGRLWSARGFTAVDPYTIFKVAFCSAVGFYDTLIEGE